jgi:MFS family permease
MIMWIMWAGFYAFGVFFKPVLNEFGWTRAMTAGAFSLASLINALLTIGVGKLTDRFGPRIVMTFAGLILGLGFFLMSQIRSASHLYLFYGILVGAGMSCAFIPPLSTVVRWFLKRRGLMSGIVAAGSGMGSLTGPPLASLLGSIYGWRVSYEILGCVVLVGVVLLAQLLKRNPEQVGQVAYGENKIGLQRNPSKAEGLSLRETLKSPRFLVFFPTGFCYGYCVFAIMVHMVPHAIELKISAIKAANILATIGGLSIIGKVLLGRAGDIIGSRYTLILGFILMCFASIWLLPAKTAWMLFVFGGVFGFGLGGIAVSHSPLIAELFGLKSHGLIFGVLNIGVMTGAATGPLLTGYLFDVTNSYQTAFLLCAVISFIGIILTAFLRIMKR